MAFGSMLKNDQITPYVADDDEQPEAGGEASPELIPDTTPAAKMAPASPTTMTPVEHTPSFEEVAEQGHDIQNPKEKFHNTMRTFDTAQTTNRGMMLALDPNEPDYLKKLAGFQAKEGLIRSEKASYQQQHPLGTPESAHPGFGGKVMHVLGDIGNIAGTAFVPGLMPAIPGSKMNIAGNRMLGEEEIQQASHQNLEASEAAAHSAAAKGGTKQDYEPLKGPDDKPMTHNGMPLVREKGSNKLALITPQGAVEVGGQASGQAEGQDQTFFDKPNVDENKQPIGQPGLERHKQILETLTEGMKPEEKTRFLAAYSVNPDDTLVVQTKRAEDARAVAAMSGAERDRAIARDDAHNRHVDQQNEQALHRSDDSYNKQTARLDKIGKPVSDAVARMGRLRETLAKGSPQADALVAPELLTVMAGGAGSGLRMNEAEIARIVGGRSHWEDLKAAANKWSTNPETANSITADQRKQIRDLVDAVDSRLKEKQTIIDDAEMKLLNTNDPEEHRRIVADTQKKMTAIDQREPKQREEVPTKEKAKYHHSAPGKPDIHSNDGKVWYDDKGNKIE